MDAQNNQNQTQKLLSDISKAKNALTAWASVSLGLLAFVLGSLGMIFSWTGSLPNELWAFLLLLAVDIPLLLVTKERFKKYMEMKKTVKSVSQQVTPSGDYARNRDLLEQEKKSRIALIGLPLLAVMILVNEMGMIYVAVLAVGFVINLGKLKKVQKQLKESGVTKEERDSFAQDYKKSNKSKRTVIVVVLVIAMVVAIAMDSSKPKEHATWKDLGVSEREYMEIYNRIKYGETGRGN